MSRSRSVNGGWMINPFCLNLLGKEMGNPFELNGIIWEDKFHFWT